MSTAAPSRAPLTAVGACLVLVVGLTVALVTRCGGDDEAGGVEVGEPGASTTTTWPLDDPPNLALERPEAFLDALRAELGPGANIRRIVFYDDFGFAEVQDREVPHHLDEYDFRDGHLDPETEPVAAGRYDDWRDELFPLESVQAATVAAVGRAALEEFSELEHPEVTHLSVERSYNSDSGTDDGPLRYSVYVSDPIRGGSGSITTDSRGEILDVYRS